MAGLYQFIMNVNYRIRHNDRQQMKSLWYLLGQTYGSISCELPFWKKKTIISCHIPADSLLLCHYWTAIADCGKKEEEVIKISFEVRKNQEIIKLKHLTRIFSLPIAVNIVLLPIVGSTTL